MHAAEGEVLGASTVEDGFAGDDGLLRVGIITGTELGMVQLQGDGMHNIACNEYITEAIDCMTRSVTRSGYSGNGA